MEDLHKRIQEKKELIKAKITDSVTNQDEILEKGKSMPIGTISHGRKKIAEGKWVEVSKEGKTKHEHEQAASISEEKAKQLNSKQAPFPVTDKDREESKKLYEQRDHHHFISSSLSDDSVDSDEANIEAAEVVSKILNDNSYKISTDTVGNTVISFRNNFGELKKEQIQSALDKLGMKIKYKNIENHSLRGMNTIKITIF